MVYTYWKENKEAELPSVEETLLLARRELPDPKDKQSPEKARVEQLFDVYHDVLLPKVCGVQR